MHVPNVSADIVILKEVNGKKMRTCLMEEKKSLLVLTAVGAAILMSLASTTHGFPLESSVGTISPDSFGRRASAVGSVSR